jgi:hypothetical protein
MLIFAIAGRPVDNSSILAHRRAIWQAGLPDWRAAGVVHRNELAVPIISLALA